MGILLILSFLPCLFVCGYGDTPCGNLEVKIQSGSSGRLYSPTLQDTQPEPKICSWTFHVPQKTGLKLKFLRFELQERNKCELDQLEIYESSGLKRTLCGRQNPNDIVYTGETQVFIKSKTKGLFEIQYEAVEVTCIAENQLTCRNGLCTLRENACDGIDDCGDGTDEEGCGQKTIDPVQCGKPTIEPELLGQDRIIGGEEAVPGSWPWQVSIQEKRFFPSGHICGGSLINNYWVITAAHCVSDTRAQDLRISLGAHRNFLNEASRRIRYVQRVVIHPSFSSLGRSSDVALVKMNAPVAFTDGISPVCLPAFGEDPKAGDAIVTGWGETRDSRSDSRPLQQVKISVIEWRKCKDSWQHRLPDNTVCTAGWRGAPCTGDSGGPLVTYSNTSESWTLVGITSFGSYSCGGDGKPTVYGQISAFVPWIKRTMV